MIPRCLEGFHDHGEFPDTKLKFWMSSDRLSNTQSLGSKIMAKTTYLRIKKPSIKMKLPEYNLRLQRAGNQLHGDVKLVKCQKSSSYIYSEI